MEYIPRVMLIVISIVLIMTAFIWIVHKITDKI